MDEATIRERLALLDDVLDRHLGQRSRREGPHRQQCAADLLIAVAAPPDITVGAINPKLERERWLNVKRLSRELAQALHELEWRTVFEAAVASLRLSEDVAGQDHGTNRDSYWLMCCEDMTEQDWQKFWVQVASIDRLIDKITPGVNDFMDSAPAVGRRNMANVVAIDCLRGAWEERKNSPAP